MSVVACPALCTVVALRQKLFSLTPRMKTPSGEPGACVSTIPGVCNATGTGRREAVLRLFPLFYGTKVSCIGYLDHGVAVSAWHARCLALPEIGKCWHLKTNGKHLLAIYHTCSRWFPSGYRIPPLTRSYYVFHVFRNTRPSGGK